MTAMGLHSLVEVTDPQHVLSGQRGKITSVEGEKVIVEFDSHLLRPGEHIFHQSQIGPLTTVPGFEVLTRRAIGLLVSRVINEAGNMRSGVIHGFAGTDRIEVQWKDGPRTITNCDRETIETCSDGWRFAGREIDDLADVQPGCFLVHGSELWGEVADVWWDEEGRTVDLVRAGGTRETRVVPSDIRVAVKA